MVVVMIRPPSLADINRVVLHRVVHHRVVTDDKRGLEDADALMVTTTTTATKMNTRIKAAAQTEVMTVDRKE